MKLAIPALCLATSFADEQTGSYNQFTLQLARLTPLTNPPACGSDFADYVAQRFTTAHEISPDHVHHIVAAVRRVLELSYHPTRATINKFLLTKPEVSLDQIRGLPESLRTLEKEECQGRLEFILPQCTQAVRAAASWIKAEICAENRSFLKTAQMQGLCRL